MRDTPVSITELPPSPDEERRSRMIRYTIAMAIRIVCVVLLIVVPGWWRIIPAIGAIALPYFAVILANTVRTRPVSRVMRPGAVVRLPRDHDRDAA